MFVMHGRKRLGKGNLPSVEELAKKKAKLEAYKRLSAVLLSKRAECDFSEKMLSLTAKMANVNPDFYSIWGYRREILMKLYPELARTGENRAHLSQIYTAELKLSENALTQRNPKCYYAWHHRKWILSLGGVTDFERELELSGKFLERDERNFHCWNYRRCVQSFVCGDPSRDVHFTKQMIEKNFSNYSAWHERSRIMQLEPAGALSDEIFFVDKAIFTEPDDQSAWIYHRWLMMRAMHNVGAAPPCVNHLGPETNLYYERYMSNLYQCGSKHCAPFEITMTVPRSDPNLKKEDLNAGVINFIVELVDSEIGKFQELVEVEAYLKWPKLHLAFLLEQKLCLHRVCKLKKGVGELKHTYRSLLSDLCDIDAMHKGYYVSRLQHVDLFGGGAVFSYH